jgi:hypothetical protein
MVSAAQANDCSRRREEAVGESLPPHVGSYVIRWRLPRDLLDSAREKTRIEIFDARQVARMV